MAERSALITLNLKRFYLKMGAPLGLIFCKRVLVRGHLLATLAIRRAHSSIAKRGDDQRLSARAAQHFERAQAGRGHISLRKARVEQFAFYGDRAQVKDCPIGS